MKAWFAKFRISVAHDRPRPLLDSLCKKTAPSEEVRRFAAHCSALDHALAQPPSEPVAPPSLHASIMRALRAAQRPAPTRPDLALRLWLPATGAVALALALAVWRPWLTPKPAPSSGQTSTISSPLPVSDLHLATAFSWPAPVAVVSPLTDELDRLDRDLDNTAQFILACLP